MSKNKKPTEDETAPVQELPDSIMRLIREKVRKLAFQGLEKKLRPHLPCPIRIATSASDLEEQQYEDPSAQFGFIMSLKKGVTPPSCLDDVITHAPVFASRTFVVYEFEDEEHFFLQMQHKMPVVEHVRFLGLPPLTEKSMEANFTYPKSCYRENKDLTGPYTKVNYGRSLKQLRTFINRFDDYLDLDDLIIVGN